MPFPTTNVTQELPAINQILASCGQAPVTTLDQTNPEVAIAYETLLQVSREVQGEGWTFNKEAHYTMTPNLDDYILIPNNILQIKLTNNAANTNNDAVRRSGPYTSNPKNFTINNNGSSGGTNGTLTKIATTTNNSGSGLTVNLTIANNVVTEVIVNEPGLNYAKGDIITIDKALSGTSVNVVAAIAAMSPVNGPMLYDRYNHTYKWTDESVDVDIVWFYDWVDIPGPVQDFITARAAALVSSRIVGDPNQYQTLQQHEAYTRTIALEYETNQGEYTFFGTPPGQLDSYTSYKPYQVLQR